MKALTHLLDTSVYSQRLRPKPDPQVVKHWQRLGDHRLAVSAVCEAELLYGLENRGSRRLWQEYHEALENALTILPLDKPVAKIFSQIKNHAEASGESRADFDLLIASSALAHGLILVTANVRHFAGIPGLVVENWFT